MAFPINKRHDLGFTPSRKLRDICFRKAQHIGHHLLRQRSREGLHEVNVTLTRELIDQGIHMPRNHVAMTLCTRTNPRVGKFFSVCPPQLNRGPQGEHGNHHHIDVIHLLRRRVGGRQLLDHQRGNWGKTQRVLYDPINIVVATENKGVSLRREALSCQPVHRRFAMQYGVSVVPVFLRTGRKQIDIVKLMRARDGV